MWPASFFLLWHILSILFGRHWDKESNLLSVDLLLICSFTMARIWPGWNLIQVSMWVTGTQVLQPSPAASQDATSTEAKIGSKARCWIQGLRCAMQASSGHWGQGWAKCLPSDGCLDVLCTPHVFILPGVWGLCFICFILLKRHLQKLWVVSPSLYFLVLLPPFQLLLVLSFCHGDAQHLLGALRM